MACLCWSVRDASSRVKRPNLECERSKRRAQLVGYHVEQIRLLREHLRGARARFFSRPARADVLGDLDIKGQNAVDLSSRIPDGQVGRRPETLSRVTRHFKDRPFFSLDERLATLEDAAELLREGLTAMLGDRLEQGLAFDRAAAERFNRLGVNYLEDKFRPAQVIQDRRRLTDDRKDTASFGRFPVGAFSQRGGDPFLVGALLFQPREVGDILDLVNDVLYRAVAREKGRVHWPPVAPFKMATCGSGAPDIIRLSWHGVGSPQLNDAREGRAKVERSRRTYIGGTIGQHLKDAAVDDLVSLGHRGPKVRVARSDDGETRCVRQED